MAEELDADGRPVGVIGALMRHYGVWDVSTLALRMGKPGDTVQAWAANAEVPVWALRQVAEVAGATPEQLGISPAD